MKLTVVLDYYEAMEPYSRIGLLRSYGNSQSYWTTAKLWKLIVVLDYYEAMETYSRIGLLRSYGNSQSYWITEAPKVPIFPSVLSPNSPSSQCGDPTAEGTGDVGCEFDFEQLLRI